MADNVWAAMGFDDDLQVTLFHINSDNVVAWKETESFEYLVAYADPSGATIGLFEYEGTGPLETFSVRNPNIATVEAFQVTPGLAAIDVLDRGQENPFMRIVRALTEHGYRVEPGPTALQHVPSGDFAQAHTIFATLAALESSPLPPVRFVDIRGVVHEPTLPASDSGS